jgi:L-alanine-DL-glutamate epimerase-like enolase superfamily enzyme
MHITSIKSYPIDTNLIVKVETGEGIYGIGEAGVAVQTQATMKVLEFFEEWLIGRDPMDIEGLWQELFRYTRRKEGTLLCAAISGIDMALWDIKGKALNVPVWQLLGGKARDRVRLYAHIVGQDDEELIANSQVAVERGFTVLRYGLDDPDMSGGFDAGRAIRHSARKLEAVRSSLGDAVELCVDVHQRLSPVHGVELCNALASLHIFFVEDPIRPEDPTAYRQVRARTNQPLASGENLYSKWQFRPLIEEELIDYLRIDLGAIGGFTEARKTAAMAETHYLDVVPHCANGPLLEQATLHFSFATSNLAVQEHTCSTYEGGKMAWWNAILPGLADFHSGWSQPPQAPGLGVEFDEEAANRHEGVRRQMPHWRKPDGSVQDW